MKRWIQRAWWVVVAAMVSAAPAQPSSQILEMWGDDAPPQGTVTSLDLQGVSVMMGNGTSVLLDWTRVRDVQASRAEQFDEFRSDARAIWRASVRLERDDLVNAEPLLEDLFTRYGPHAGASSSLVARGLLRCRIAAGARAPAVESWLGTLRADRWTPGGAGADAPDSVIDASTGLAPLLAPIWLDDDQSAWLLRNDPASVVARGAGPGSERMRLAALGTLYRVSAIYEQDPGDREAIETQLRALFDQIDPETLREPGVGLVQEIVLARVGNEEQRAAARTALGERLARRPEAWTESWIRVAIGRSMILESDTEVRRRGVVQLLHAPARFAAQTPELAAIALAQGAVTMRSLGDDESGAMLRRELLDRFPGSEGARWRKITEWTPGGLVSRGGNELEPRTDDRAHEPEGNDRS